MPKALELEEAFINAVNVQRVGHYRFRFEAVMGFEKTSCRTNPAVLQTTLQQERMQDPVA